MLKLCSNYVIKIRHTFIHIYVLLSSTRLDKFKNACETIEQYKYKIQNYLYDICM